MNLNWHWNCSRIDFFLNFRNVPKIGAFFCGVKHGTLLVIIVIPRCFKAIHFASLFVIQIFRDYNSDLWGQKKTVGKKQKPRRNQGENINVLKTIGALYCGRGFINMTGTLTNFIYWGLLTVNLLWALQKHAFCIVKLSASSRRLKSPRWVNQSCSQTLVLNMFQRNKSVLPRSSRWVSWG